MIFVTVGTQKFQFNRLLSMVDNLIGKGVITEEVIAQTGSCTYIPKYISNYSSFIKEDELRDIMKRCDYLITHGGVGSIVPALELGKKVIVVPRMKKYKEHIDNHQSQIAEQYKEQGYLWVANNEQELESLISRRRNLEFKPFNEKYDNMIEKIIREFIGGAEITPARPKSSNWVYNEQKKDSDGNT